MSFKNEYEDIFLNKYIKPRLYIKIYQTKLKKKKKKRSQRSQRGKHTLWGIMGGNDYIHFFSPLVITLWGATKYFRKINLLFNLICRKMGKFQESYLER